MTLYAHLEKGLSLKIGDTIKQGDIIGKMSDSGNAYGKHLHFEVFKNNKKIDPTKYLYSSFSSNNNKYKLGDIVDINGVYISSTSNRKLIPRITRGKITKIINNVNNPYLLDNGFIGWVNDKVIISKEQFLKNNNYYGFSIVDALNEINIDSSYTNRRNIALLNGINNYRGTSEQNMQLVSLLKQGELRYK